MSSKRKNSLSSKSPSSKSLKRPRKSIKSPTKIISLQIDENIVKIDEITQDCNILYNSVMYQPSHMIHIKNRDGFLLEGKDIISHIQKSRPKKDICPLFSNFHIKKSLQRAQDNQKKYPNITKNTQWLILMGKSNTNDNLVVGLAQFYLSPSKSGISENVLYLDNFCTYQMESKPDNSCRLGRIILDKLNRIGKEMGISRMELKNFDESSSSFYKYLGFTSFINEADLEHEYFYHDL